MTTGRSTALHGQLQVFSLNTILSALNLQKVTGMLTLAQYAKYAQILIKNGEIWDAWSETDRGLSALLPLFGWEEGFFSFEVKPVESRTITMSLPVLQVRSAVYLEELKASQRNGGALPSPANVPLPGPVSIFTNEVPSAEHVLRINQDSEGEVTIQPEHWSVLRFLVAGPKTVAEMAELTNSQVETFVPFATELVRNKMVQVLPPGQH